MMWKVTDKGYKQCRTQQRAYTTSSAMSFIFICRKCKRPANLTVLLILYFIYLAKSVKVFTVLFYRWNESLHSWTAARETAARFWFIGADFSERTDEIINSHMHTPSQHCCSVTKGGKKISDHPRKWISHLQSCHIQSNLNRLSSPFRCSAWTSTARLYCF